MPVYGLQIVTTVKPLHDLVKMVVGDKHGVSFIIPPGSSPHHYVLKPSQMRLIKAADCLIWVGREVEGLSGKAIQGVANHAPQKVLQILREIDTLNIYRLRENAALTGHTCNHGGGVIDGHVWLDPHNAIEIAKVVSERISKIDPTNKVYYEVQLERAIASIELLKEQLERKLRPVRQRPFAVLHDGYQYFERAFGLVNRGVAGVDGVHEEMTSGRKIRVWLDNLRAEKISCLFCEPNTNSMWAKMCPAAIHFEVLDPYGANTEGYIEMMQALAELFYQCLSMKGELDS